MYPSPRRSPDRKIFFLVFASIFPSFPGSARTATISPFHNVREVAHESKCECPFEVSHALLIGSGVGNLRRCWRLWQRLWSQRVLNDLPLTVKKWLTISNKSISSIRKTCLNYSQLPCLFPYRKPTLLNLF